MPEPIVVDPPAPKLFKEIAAPEFHDRGWAKPFLEKPWTPETQAEILKKLDGAEALIGKKTLVPGADAKPDEIEAFYSKVGLEKPEGYDIKLLGEKPDEAFANEVRAAAHKGRLSQTQLNGFLAELGPKVAARQKAVADAQAARDAEFEAIVKATFGADNAKVLARASDALKENVPEALRPHIDKLDNNALAILTGVVNAFMVKYMSEDDLKSKEGSAGGGNNDKETLSAEAIKLQSSEAFRNHQHPDYAATQKRVTEIYAHPAFKS